MSRILPAAAIARRWSPPAPKRMEALGLEHSADGLQRPDEVSIRHPEHRGCAVRWLSEPEQHPKRRALPGAVRTEEAGQALRPDLEAQLPHGDDLTETLRQCGGLDRERAVGLRSRSFDSSSVIIRVLPSLSGFLPLGKTLGIGARGTGTAQPVPTCSSAGTDAAGVSSSSGGTLRLSRPAARPRTRMRTRRPGRGHGVGVSGARARRAS